MKNLARLLAFVAAFMFASTQALASEATTHKVKAKDAKQTKEVKHKKRRRKKVEMCHECGKAETECDCEGHGNDGHEHGDH